jgi:hypothetical protein
MATGLEAVRNFRNLPEIKKRWKGKPHFTPFIGNQGSAYIAAHFAGKNALVLIRLVVVEMQMIDTGGYPDVMLVEYGGPLHGGTMQFFADQTMAYLCIHRIRTHFVLDCLAVTARPVFSFKCVILYRCIVGAEFIFLLNHIWSLILELSALFDYFSFW